MSSSPPSTVATVHSGALAGGGAREPRCQLVVIEGPEMGRAVEIGREEMVAGTAPECDLVLSDDRVSHRHLALRVEPGGGFRARDLGSTNGTLYEGSLVSEAVLPAGATLKLGKTFVRIQPEPEPLEVAPSQSRRFGELVAESLAMREVFAVLELAAPTDVTVLLEGETGTGKELAARAIHEASRRRRGPLVAVDCGALPESLLESELFGHVRGAFTGASATRQGAFMRASGGTLFLDELASVSLPVQARLLRVLEERRVRAVGSDVEREVDVRIVGASRADLAARVAEGTFRPDLYYRLSVVRVVLPPLRARREDIAPIAAEILRMRGIEPGPVEGPGLHRLVAHAWLGNARELRNVIDRALALRPRAASFADLVITLSPAPSDDPLAIRSDLPFGEAKQAIVDAFEERYLRDVLAREGGNISAAARAADVDRKHLRSLLHKHGLIADDDQD